MLGISEYAAQLAESVYSVVLQALLFIYASAPDVNPDETALLGPEWPSPETLFDLQASPSHFDCEYVQAPAVLCSHLECVAISASAERCCACHAAEAVQHAGVQRCSGIRSRREARAEPGSHTAGHTGAEHPVGSVAGGHHQRRA